MKLKTSCCEKYRRKAKVCKRCPLLGAMKKKQRRKYLKKLKKKRKRRARAA